MAFYCLGMLEIALVLAGHDPAYEDVAVKFFEHFTLIQAAMNDEGLWDEADGFYYDQIRRASDGDRWPVRARSMTGLIPLYAAVRGRPRGDRAARGLPGSGARVPADAPAPLAAAIRVETDGARPSLLALVGRRSPAAPAAAAAATRRVPLPVRRAGALGRLPRAAVRRSRQDGT